jgi:hypothetical protein
LFEVADTPYQGFNKYPKPNTTSHRSVAGNFKELSQWSHLKPKQWQSTKKKKPSCNAEGLFTIEELIITGE